MKKHLIVIGIAVLLLSVGLGGCNEVGIGITNIGDITANPENYYGKEVTIEGECHTFIKEITDDKNHQLSYEYSNLLIGMYQVTGEIKESTYGTPYIDVTRVKAL